MSDWNKSEECKSNILSPSEKDKHVPVCVALVVFRKAIIENLQFESISYCEDWLFAMSVWSKAKAVYHSNSVLYFYYQRSSSSIYNMPVSVIDDFLGFSYLALKNANLSGKQEFIEYVEFSIRETILGCIMTYLYKDLKDKKMKHELFTKMCSCLLSLNKEFNFPLDKKLRMMLKYESYFLGCIILYWRYKPRHFLAKHPRLLSFFRFLRGK